MYTTFGLSIPASAGPHDDPVAEAVRAERPPPRLPGATRPS